jgi:chorismate synthase
MAIERDTVKITGGLWRGRTTGAPLAFLLANRDFKIGQLPDLAAPRPGHADLAGILKFNEPIRPILERSSARETALRVASGAVARELLGRFGIRVLGHVTQIGDVEAETSRLTFDRIASLKRTSDLNTADRAAEDRMRRRIAQAMKQGDSLGGIFELRAKGVPPGLGSCMVSLLRFDSRLAAGLMSIPSVKAVEIGLGRRLAALRGRETHDAIFYSKARGFYRRTNRAGGIEGGMTNGSEVVASVTMKPIATLVRPLPSVNLKTRRPTRASVERADTCAVPAGSVVGEAVLCLTLADALLEKTGGDSLAEVERNFHGYLKQLAKYHL